MKHEIDVYRSEVSNAPILVFVEKLGFFHKFS